MINLQFTLLVALSIVSSTRLGVSAERYLIGDLFGDMPYIENEQGHRFLQLAGGRRPDVNASDTTCQITGGDDFTCYLATQISADSGEAVEVDFSIKCELDKVTGFDFRRSRSCACYAFLKHNDGREKACTCSACPIGFGRSPISIDCESAPLLEGQADADANVIDSCTSIDCDFACNGTCAFDCTQSGPDCQFCAPPEEGGTTGGTGGSAATSITAGVFAAIAVSAAAVLSLLS